MCYNGGMINSIADIACALAETAKKLADSLENILLADDENFFHEFLSWTNAFAVVKLTSRNFPMCALKQLCTGCLSVVTA